MNAKRKINSSHAKQSEMLVNTVTETFLGRLRQEAVNKGGALTIKDIEGLKVEFTNKKEALKAVFDRSFEDYVKSHERAVMNLSRDFPFDRLIVSKFAHLFKEDSEILRQDHSVSRRVLPGFFVAMNLMLGLDSIEALQERTELIVDRLSEGRELEFSWDEVYKDEEGNELILDALVAMAVYFDDFCKRTEWFLNLMNDNARPPTEEENPDLRMWAFSDQGFRKLLNALFSDLKETLDDYDGRLKITNKYGIETCVALTRTLKQFT